MKIVWIRVCFSSSISARGAGVRYFPFCSTRTDCDFSCSHFPPQRARSEHYGVPGSHNTIELRKFWVFLPPHTCTKLPSRGTEMPMLWLNHFSKVCRLAPTPSNPHYCLSDSSNQTTIHTAPVLSYLWAKPFILKPPHHCMPYSNRKQSPPRWSRTSSPRLCVSGSCCVSSGSGMWAFALFVSLHFVESVLFRLIAHLFSSHLTLGRSLTHWLLATLAS